MNKNKNEHPNQIISLTPRHLKIVDLCVKGWPPKDIASHLGMSNYAISIIMKSPTFKHEFAIRRAIHEERDDGVDIREEDEVTKTLREGARAAAHKLVAHIDSVEDSISVKSCAEVLDRTGYTKKKDEVAAIIAPTIIINEKEGKALVESMEMVGGA